MESKKIAWTSAGTITMIIALAIAIVMLLSITYALHITRFNAIANEPTVKARNIVLSSILKKPSLFDFVVFQNNTQPGSPLWMLRVCGIPGDTVEIRNGNLWVNNRRADSLLTLSHSYLIHSRDTLGMNISANAAVPILNADSVKTDSIMITYADKLVSLKPGLLHRYLLPETIPDSYIQKQFQQPWNIDHFGPIAVPEHAYFLLGDNRSNAMDSRYFGFVREKDFKGTALNF
ncbi:MAG: signal peptidase I [Flavitalea sp.]